MEYTKLPLDYTDLILMLKRRGLLFNNEQEAEKCLQSISYFRLANYMRPMEQDKVSHSFKPDSYFENAVDLYYFDKELRMILFDVIQTFEIALRSKFNHHASLKHGSFWFADASLAVSPHLFHENLSHLGQEIKRSKEDFIKGHLKTYSSPPFPPAWKTLEVVSFGTLSKMLCNFSDTKIKKRISKELGIPQHLFLESWVRSAVALRNCLAHHARVWNRKYPQMPKLPTKMPFTWITHTELPMMKLYPQLCLLLYVQNLLRPHNDCTERLKLLFQSHPNVDLSAMGFPIGWGEEPLWQ